MRSSKTMPYHFGLTLELYPSNQQKEIIAVSAGSSLYVYNRLVAYNEERYSLSKTAALCPADKARLDYIDSLFRNTDLTLAKAFYHIAPFLADRRIHSDVTLNAIKNYQAAWNNFKKNKHASKPTFHKKRHNCSYQVNNRYSKKSGYGVNDGSIRFEDLTHLVLPILGRVRVSGPKKRIKRLLSRSDTRITTVTIGKRSDMSYYVSIAFASEHPFVEPLMKTGAFCGIDLNISNFLYDSDGQEVQNRKFRRSIQKKIAELQRSMSRKAERAKKEHRKLRDCKNYQKDRRKLAHLMRRMQDSAHAFRHEVSKKYVESQDFIFVEDLRVGNLLKNHRLALAISECGWSEFIGMLEYKAELYGKTLIKVPPQNTSQTCSACGHVLEKDEKLKLSDREWICPACGTYHVRDHNAAKNILARGMLLV